MNLSDGKYLGHEICACSGDWLIVYDGKFNYYLFNTVAKPIRASYKRNRMPSNGVGGGKQTEYYSTFDNALRNLVKVVANDGFLTSTRSP